MNTFSNSFTESLRQLKERDSTVADQVYTVALLHLPRIHDPSVDRDNGYLENRNTGEIYRARRAITPERRHTLLDQPDRADFNDAYNYVIGYRGDTPPGFYVCLLIHTRQLNFWNIAGLW
ncbi:MULTISPECIES: hypothetical protein [unclassified Streptomyces]|uniref:Uncharacterized protein n=1 Tax=Streptomyces sp. NBC_00060 TaxID=2975636 RepID=A0AAU2H2A6_9ACTN